jgi:hypothetical protein
MSFKYPKNVIVIFSVVAALLGATVLLGGYANSKPADTQAPTKVGCCPASGTGCPMMAASVECPKMTAAQVASTDDSGTPCTTSCPKPCCAGENAEGYCDNPCPIPCPKPCCAEGGCCVTAEKAGCCPTSAAETATKQAIGCIYKNSRQG